MDSALFQPFPQPGYLLSGGEAFPGNPSCSSYEENLPVLPKFWDHGHLKPICKQLEKTLENMENQFLFLAAAPNCLFS